MTEISIRGTRRNLAGLLRLMADEIDTDGRSITAFSEQPGWDPTVKVDVWADDSGARDHDTTVQVRR
jgi:hypothetical protein